MDEQPEGLAELLANLRTEFLLTAVERVGIIRSEADRLAIAADPGQRLDRLIREAHTLKGGGATFGFPSLTEAGGTVEREGKTLLASGARLSSVEPLRAAIEGLEAALEAVRSR
jgi:chemotaxis protein histidine kinase CheA